MNINCFYARYASPNKIPYGNRKCKICDYVEDEFHFVLECSLYVEIRKEYISKYFWKRPSMFKCIEFLCTDNKKATKKLSTYVKKAFRIRKENMPR